MTTASRRIGSEDSKTRAQLLDAAEVLLLDRNLDRLRLVDQIHRGRIMTLASIGLPFVALAIAAHALFGFDGEPNVNGGGMDNLMADQATSGGAVLSHLVPLDLSCGSRLRTIDRRRRAGWAAT